MEVLPPFVGPEWLGEHLDQVTLVDCRWSLDGSVGRDDYLAAHLPGAVYADLDTDLSAPPSPAAGRHPLPDPEEFAAAMRRLGVDDDAIVVAYDQGHGAIAARLVWMLRVTGRSAAVLDGGFKNWDGPVEAGAVDTAAGNFTPRPWPADAVADADDVAAAASGGGTVIDARAAERYRGDTEPVDPRPGHIPGAMNVPHTDTADESGRLREPESLRDLFAELRAADDAIVYCGSGVTACQDVLAAEHAGLPRPRLYPGSWSQWSADADRPARRGADP